MLAIAEAEDSSNSFIRGQLVGNHVHSVVSAKCAPELVLNAFKANATRTMRASGSWRSGKTPWVEKGSKRRLWTEQDLINAIVYVKYEQGLPLS
jgi:REP element-mobilizing transposase RayT